MAVEVLLDPAPAAVQGVAGQAHHVEGIHHRDRVGQLLAGGGLEPGEPVHRDHLDRVAPRPRTLGQVLNARLERPSTMSSSRAGPVPLADPGQVDDHGDVLVPAAGVPPDVLIDADRGDPRTAPGRRSGPACPGQDRVVGGVPGDPEPLGDPRDGQVLDHDAFQRPPQPAPGELRPRLGRPGRVLAPHVPAPGAPVAPDRHLERGRAPAQRLVGQPPLDGVAGRLRSRSGDTTGPGSATRQASTARSGSSRWPVTSRPSSSRRQNVVRSGQAKVTSDKSRSSGWSVWNLHLQETSTPTRPHPLPPLHPQL